MTKSLWQNIVSCSLSTQQNRTQKWVSRWNSCYRHKHYCWHASHNKILKNKHLKNLTVSGTDCAVCLNYDAGLKTCRNCKRHVGPWASVIINHLKALFSINILEVFKYKHTTVNSSFLMMQSVNVACRVNLLQGLCSEQSCCQSEPCLTCWRSWRVKRMQETQGQSHG